MISTAGRTGRLGDVMVTIGEFYEEEGEQQVRDLTKIYRAAGHHSHGSGRRPCGHVSHAATA